MTFNVGMADRLVRIILGVALVYGAIFYPNVPYSSLGWIGVVIIATGLFGWCGLYKLLGLSTAPKE